MTEQAAMRGPTMRSFQSWFFDGHWSMRRLQPALGTASTEECEVPKRTTGYAIAQTMTVVAIIAFWWLYVQHLQLRAQRLEALTRGQRPYALNGMRLPLETALEPFPEDLRGLRRYLLLMTSDNCMPSRVAVEPLRELLRNISYGPDAGVILLSVAGVELPRVLARELRTLGVSHHIVSLRSQSAFVKQTDLSYTPALILVDSDFRVRMVAPRLTEVVAREIKRFLGATMERSDG